MSFSLHSSTENLGGGRRSSSSGSNSSSRRRVPLKSSIGTDVAEGLGRGRCAGTTRRLSRWMEIRSGVRGPRRGSRRSSGPGQRGETAKRLLRRGGVGRPSSRVGSPGRAARARAEHGNREIYRLDARVATDLAEPVRERVRRDRPGVNGGAEAPPAPRPPSAALTRRPAGWWTRCRVPGLAPEAGAARAPRPRPVPATVPWIASIARPDRTYVTVYGRLAVLEALADERVGVAQVLLARTARGEGVDAIVAAAARRGVALRRVAPEKVTRVSGNGRHDQGVVADVRGARAGRAGGLGPAGRAGRPARARRGHQPGQRRHDHPHRGGRRPRRRRAPPGRRARRRPAGGQGLGRRGLPGHAAAQRHGRGGGRGARPGRAHDRRAAGDGGAVDLRRRRCRPGPPSSSATRRRASRRRWRNGWPPGARSPSPTASSRSTSPAPPPSSPSRWRAASSSGPAEG